MGPRCTEGENNHSNGFVSPLLRETQMYFVLFSSDVFFTLDPKTLGLSLRTGIVDNSSFILS